MSIANTHSKWINGNLVFYPEGNDQRWIDVIGDNVIKYTNDFEVCPHTTIAANDANCPEWIITHTSAGTGMSGMTAGDLLGGSLNIYAAANENDGINAQLRNKSFKVTANSPIYFGVRWRIDEATQSDAVFGIAEPDTSVIAGVPNGILIGTTDGGAYVKLHIIDAVTTDKTLVGTSSLAADTMMIDEFIAWSTDKVDYWHNGTYIGALTAAIPSTASYITLSYLNGAGTMASKGVKIDWVRCFQLVASRAT